MCKRIFKNYLNCFRVNYFPFVHLYTCMLIHSSKHIFMPALARAIVETLNAIE